MAYTLSMTDRLTDHDLTGILAAHADRKESGPDVEALVREIRILRAEQFYCRVCSAAPGERCNDAIWSAPVADAGVHDERAVIARIDAS
jgi:hypothetical protein